MNNIEILEGNKIKAFYVGLPKCASTWLFHTLKNFKNIGLSTPRDLHFFDLYFFRGERWYHKFFNMKNELNIDICHDYILYKSAIERIYKYNKKALIIYHCRDPVKLVFSLYKETIKSNFIYFKEHGYEAPKTFEEFIENPLTKEILNYREHLDCILNFFPNDQIFSSTLNYIKSNPNNYLNNLLKKIDSSTPFHHQEIFAIRPNKDNIFINFFVRIFSKIAVLIRRNGNPLLMRIVSFKSLLLIKNPIKSSFSKRNKNLNKEIISKYDYYKGQIEDIFLKINGLNYQDFIETYKIKNA